MKYRCLECGEVFEESELLEVMESRGEFWGFPCAEHMYYSPCCIGDYEELNEEEEGE